MRSIASGGTLCESHDCLRPVRPLQNAQPWLITTFVNIRINNARLIYRNIISDVIPHEFLIECAFRCHKALSATPVDKRSNLAVLWCPRQPLYNYPSLTGHDTIQCHHQPGHTVLFLRENVIILYFLEPEAYFCWRLILCCIGTAPRQRKATVPEGLHHCVCKARHKGKGVMELRQSHVRWWWWWWLVR